MVSSGEENNWSQRRSVEIVEHMLSWLTSIPNFKQLMQQWIQDSDDGEDFVDEVPKTKQDFKEP